MDNGSYWLSFFDGIPYIKLIPKRRVLTPDLTEPEIRTDYVGERYARVQEGSIVIWEERAWWRVTSIGKFKAQVVRTRRKEGV